MNTSTIPLPTSASAAFRARSCTHRGHSFGNAGDGQCRFDRFSDDRCSWHRNLRELLVDNRTLGIEGTYRLSLDLNLGGG